MTVTWPGHPDARVYATLSGQNIGQILGRHLHVHLIAFAKWNIVATSVRRGLIVLQTVWTSDKADDSLRHLRLWVELYLLDWLYRKRLAAIYLYYLFFVVKRMTPHTHTHWEWSVMCRMASAPAQTIHHRIQTWQGPSTWVEASWSKIESRVLCGGCCFFSVCQCAKCQCHTFNCLAVSQSHYCSLFMPAFYFCHIPWTTLTHLFKFHHLFHQSDYLIWSLWIIFKSDLIRWSDHDQFHFTVSHTLSLCAFQSSRFAADLKMLLAKPSMDCSHLYHMTDTEATMLIEKNRDDDVTSDDLCWLVSISIFNCLPLNSR